MAVVVVVIALLGLCQAKDKDLYCGGKKNCEGGHWWWTSTIYGLPGVSE